MANRKRVKYDDKHYIDILVCKRSDAMGWTLEFGIEEHGADIIETMFYSKEAFSTSEEAVKAGVVLGCREIERGFQTVA